MQRDFLCDNVYGHICNFIIDRKLELRANIKFCAKLGKSATETFDMIRGVYGNETTSCARCYEWHAWLKNGRTSLDDDKRSGRSSTRSTSENTETNRLLVHEDRRRSINDIAPIVDVSYGTVQAILMSDIAAKFVPKRLREDIRLKRPDAS